MAAFRLTSPAFEHDDALPAEYSADGGNRSPALAWSGVPEGTKELVLVVDDPDAESGVFTHWLVYGIPPEVSELPEDLPRDVVIDDPVELVQGLNEFDESGWTGPTASEDRGPHRLFFRLHALDVELLELPPGATRSELRAAAKGHILATAELVGIV